jgi:hypothetical protein
LTIDGVGGLSRNSSTSSRGGNLSRGPSGETNGAQALAALLPSSTTTATTTTLDADELKPKRGFHLKSPWSKKRKAKKRQRAEQQRAQQQQQQQKQMSDSVLAPQGGLPRAPSGKENNTASSSTTTTTTTTTTTVATATTPVSLKANGVRRTPLKRHAGGALKARVASPQRSPRTDLTNLVTDNVSVRRGSQRKHKRARFDED